MIMAFAECPSEMQTFCLRWNVPIPITRPCAVICSRCRGMLPMAMVSDTFIDTKDAAVLLILELTTRGWKIMERGKPVCPKCQ